MTRKRKSDRKSVASPGQESGRKKMWAFRIIALVAMPLLFLGGLEAGLRLAGFGHPTKALIERDFGDRVICTPNAQFGWRFFPHQMARGFDDSLTFEKKKAPGTFRIFVLGSSAARGTPTQEFSFGRLLEAMLGDLYPDLHFEVLNAAMTAVNSHVVREIARDCAEYEPDLFILYLGNNEVVGPFGPGTVLASAPPGLPMIRANIAVKSTRTGQLFEALLGPASSHGQSSKQWSGMAMFLDKQVASESPALGPVYHHFETNLQDIYRIARRAGAKVIVANVGVNLRDCPPFASQHRDGLDEPETQQWEADYQRGIDLEARGLHAQAIERYLAAAANDDTFANLQFRLGRIYWETGDYEKARLHYQAARQHDTLRFRADAHINDIIRRTAAGRSGEGIHFADGVAAFDAASPHQIPGAELFYEHVHLTFKGNYILARTILEAVQPLLPATVKPRGEPPGEEQIARRVAYTAFDEYTDIQTMYQEYLNKPPFTNQLHHEHAMREMQSVVERLRDSVDLDRCLGQYAQAIAENPDDWRLLIKQYQLVYAAKGESDPAALEAILRQTVAIHPCDKVFHTLGKILLLQGRFNEAETALNRALFLNPASGSARFSLAVLCLKRDDRAGVIRHLEQGIRLEPADAIPPYRLLATQFDQAGKTDKAIQTLLKAIDIFPEDQTALLHCHVGELLNKQGRPEDAREHLEQALRIDPALVNNDTFVHQYNLSTGKGR